MTNQMAFCVGNGTSLAIRADVCISTSHTEEGLQFSPAIQPYLRWPTSVLEARACMDRLRIRACTRVPCHAPHPLILPPHEPSLLYLLGYDRNNLRTRPHKRKMFSRGSYTAAGWLAGIAPPTNGRTRLAMLPTPLHRWLVPGVPEGVELWIKRDDFTGATLSGNKIRKLEFLLADAVAQGCDCVVTAGGIQSNHCRVSGGGGGGGDGWGLLPCRLSRVVCHGAGRCIGNRV
jgi:hypothetical protein